MQRYSWIFVVLAVTTGSLCGCGEHVSQPMNDQGRPADPPEPEAPPVEGAGNRGGSHRGAMRPRSESIVPTRLAAAAAAPGTVRLGPS